jgi:hypothetical protein
MHFATHNTNGCATKQRATVVTLLCGYQHLTLAGPHQFAPQTIWEQNIVVSVENGLGLKELKGFIFIFIFISPGGGSGKSIYVGQ